MGPPRAGRSAVGPSVWAGKVALGGVAGALGPVAVVVHLEHKPQCGGGLEPRGEVESGGGGHAAFGVGKLVELGCGPAEAMGEAPLRDLGGSEELLAQNATGLEGVGLTHEGEVRLVIRGGGQGRGFGAEKE